MNPRKIALGLFAFSACVCMAQQPDAPPQPGAPMAQARFQSVPVPAPTYNPYYPPPAGPGGGLTGAANVISSQGDMIVSQQQGYQMREQYRQMKIDTRKKHVDEYMYERNVLPTPEDDKERQRLENVRRARNDPPPTEIWSGRALNDLLIAIQHQVAQGVRGPTVPLDPSTVSHINLTGNQTGASLGVLRGGKIQWPMAFYSDDSFGEERTKVDQLAGQALQQIQSGPADPGTIAQMTGLANKLTAQLKANVDSISPNDYIKAKRFLNEFNSTLTLLQDPSVTNYASGAWTAKGQTVGELLQGMSERGLKFAAAVAGDQSAYIALHTAMVEYYQYDPNRKWDVVAK
jgi:hypothetical protein